MAATDQNSGAAFAVVDAPPLRRQLSYTSSRGHAEPMHDRKLSYSFSTPAATLSSPSPAMSGVSSFESITVPEDLDRQSSSSESSTSSYESFYRFEAAAETGHDCSPPATQPPAVQTMMPQWSAVSNESLFSIRLGQPSEAGDLYFDTDGNFHRMNSAGRDDGMLPAASKAPSYAKSVKLVATKSIIGGESKPSPVIPTLAVGQEEDEAPATEAKETGAAAEANETGAAAGAWYMFRCCWPAAPSL